MNKLTFPISLAVFEKIYRFLFGSIAKGNRCEGFCPKTTSLLFLFKFFKEIHFLWGIRKGLPHFFVFNQSRSQIFNDNFCLFLFNYQKGVDRLEKIQHRLLIGEDQGVTRTMIRPSFIQTRINSSSQKLLYILYNLFISINNGDEGKPALKILPNSSVCQPSFGKTALLDGDTALAVNKSSNIWNTHTLSIFKGDWYVNR